MTMEEVISTYKRLGIILDFNDTISNASFNSDQPIRFKTKAFSDINETLIDRLWNIYFYVEGFQWENAMLLHSIYVCTDDIKPMMMHIGLIRIDFRFKKMFKRNAFENRIWFEIWMEDAS